MHDKCQMKLLIDMIDVYETNVNAITSDSTSLSIVDEKNSSKEVIKIWVQISLGTNCPMFANCSGFGDVREVRSSVLGQIEMFGSVRSSILKFGEHFRTFWALF